MAFNRADSEAKLAIDRNMKRMRRLRISPVAGLIFESKSLLKKLSKLIPKMRIKGYKQFGFACSENRSSLNNKKYSMLTIKNKQ